METDQLGAQRLEQAGQTLHESECEYNNRIHPHSDEGHIKTYISFSELEKPSPEHPAFCLLPDSYALPTCPLLNSRLRSSCVYQEPVSDSVWLCVLRVGSYRRLVVLWYVCLLFPVQFNSPQRHVVKSSLPYTDPKMDGKIELNCFSGGLINPLQ